jgi:hypothetical protein
MTRTTNDSFDRLTDEMERLLRSFGEPYRRGSGDFLVIQDDYGIQEVAVVLCRAIALDGAIPQIQRCIRESAPGWKVRIGADSSIDWNNDQDLVIDGAAYWSEDRQAR